MTHPALAARNLDALSRDQIELIDDLAGPPRQLILRIGPFQGFGVTFVGKIVHLALVRPFVASEVSDGDLRPVLRNRLESCGMLTNGRGVRSATASPERLIAHLLTVIDQTIGRTAKRRKRNLARAFALVIKARGCSGARWLPRQFGFEGGAGKGLTREDLVAAGFDPEAYAAHLHDLYTGHFERLRELDVQAPDAGMSAHERLAWIDETVQAFAKDRIDIAAWWKALGAL